MSAEIQGRIGSEFGDTTQNRRRNYAHIYLGNKCIKCGSTEKLEIDHIDPKSKCAILWRFQSRSLPIYKLNETLFLQELEKCQLLCQKCHIDKSLRDQDLERVKHGTLSMYTRGCRCDPCLDAKHKYDTRYNRTRRGK